MILIERDAKYYIAGYKGADPWNAPFYRRSLVFDGSEGDLNTELIDAFNSFLERENIFPDHRLTTGPFDKRHVPDKIVIINASHDNLPTSYETARVFEGSFREKGLKIEVRVVNTRDELMEQIRYHPEKVMVMSQCVDKHVYNVEVACQLERMGAVTVPGSITAPGSVFSDKDSTYRLLSNGGENWDEVAKYRKVPAEGNSVDAMVEKLISVIDEFARDTGEDVFFVKPHEGGGGLGGFRIAKKGTGYIIPDLSKVSGDVSRIEPTYLDVDLENTPRLRELLWIYRLFASDKKMRANYLWVDLPVIDAGDEKAIRTLRTYLQGCGPGRERKLSGMLMNRDEVKTKLKEAIEVFESKFKRRYVPLVNEHLNFGFWGLRAHYRLSRQGPKLETMYSRIFQLAFTPEGVGYLGADNISNKQTGELEILRLGPVNRIMLESIGGKEVLFRSLLKGAEALVALTGLLSEEERTRVPVRVQFDLAALSQRIGEGNADTARGLCLASQWSGFVRNNREWIEDSLAYYAWKKGRA